MTNTQHTPGPWKACRSHEDFNGPMWDIDDDERAEYEAKPFVSIEAESATVMCAHDLFEMRPANARLIAAAPDLLAALQAVADYLPVSGILLRNDIDAAMHAAIAKATGK